MAQIVIDIIILIFLFSLITSYIQVYLKPRSLAHDAIDLEYLIEKNLLNLES